MLTADKYNWSRLNRFQLGRYAEYLTKMEFVLCGCDVFSSEVDNQSIYFFIRTRQGNHYDVLVKSFRVETGRGTPCVFVQKDQFKIHPSVLLVLVQFVVGEPPRLYLFRSCKVDKPNPVLENRNHKHGKKGLTAWCLTLSKKKLALLAQECSFHTMVAML
jgi:hypothetical protein